MKKGERTRNYIIEKSAELFNQRGYAGTSLADITEHTGIKKGGLYRHFENKDELALEAFEFATGVVGQHFAQAIDEKQTAFDKLLSFFHVYNQVVESPPFVGGCPLLNTAVESDDSHPVLRIKAQNGMSATLDLIKAIILEGIESGEFVADIDLDAFASFTLALLEGSIMLSKLAGDDRYMHHNIETFSMHIRQHCLNINN